MPQNEKKILTISFVQVTVNLTVMYVFIHMILEEKKLNNLD